LLRVIQNTGYYICHRKVPYIGLVLSSNFWSLSPVALSGSANAHDPVAALIAGTAAFWMFEGNDLSPY
jgi:hypothetical protein